jgi:uncharacterized protein with von Willebrand factor type A (vWA) domain
MSDRQVDFDGQLVAFAEDLRSEGVAVGTSELLDAFEALEHVDWTKAAEFRETLSATIAKSPEDRRLFELVFDRFFFRATEMQAVRLEVSEPQTRVGGDEVDLDELRRQIAEALEQGSESDLWQGSGFRRARRGRSADPPGAGAAHRATAGPAGGRPSS